MIMQRTVTAVGCAALAAVAAGVPAIASDAGPAAAPAGPATVTATIAKAPAGLDPRDFELRRGPSHAAPMRALDRVLRYGGVDGVIRSSGQQKLGRGCGRPAAVPAGSLVHCFDRADTATRAWVPQGVTTASDAFAGERSPGGGRPVIVSWHNGGKVRVTVVDPDRRTYRHVLLVEPEVRGGRATFTDVGVHAGGIAWYGDTLYVADTRHGLRMFDMRRIYDLGKSAKGSTGHSGRVGLYKGKYYGHGFRYVLPQSGSWRWARGKVGRQCRGSGPPRMSWISIDRTDLPHVLAGGEYCLPNWKRGRVVTWRLEALAGGGPVRPTGGAELPADRIQGAVRTNGRWWFSQSRGARQRGRLLTARSTASGWSGVRSRASSHGPEDLSCQRGAHRVWTVAEYAGRRALWSFRAGSCA
jgi:hypothetical protein